MVYNYLLNKPSKNEELFNYLSDNFEFETEVQKKEIEKMMIMLNILRFDQESFMDIFFEYTETN